MRAMRLHEIDGSLRMDDAPTPEPGVGQVRLWVEACGVNFSDTLMVRGRYQEKPDLPAIPGMELAGVVTAAGEGEGRRRTPTKRVRSMKRVTPAGLYRWSSSCTVRPRHVRRSRKPDTCRAHAGTEDTTPASLSSLP